MKIHFGSIIPPKEFILVGITRQMFTPAWLMITKYGKYNTCLACRMLIIDFLLLLVFAIQQFDDDTCRWGSILYLSYLALIKLLKACRLSF